MGQRHIVLLKIKMAPEKNRYWMQLESRERLTITRGLAVLNRGSKSLTIFYPPQKPIPSQTLCWTSSNNNSVLCTNTSTATALEITGIIFLNVYQSIWEGPTIWLPNSYTLTEKFLAELYLVLLYKNDGIDFPSMERASANNGVDPLLECSLPKWGKFSKL